jgi:hypothetical protein
MGKNVTPFVKSVLAYFFHFKSFVIEQLFEWLQVFTKLIFLQNISIENLYIYF